MNPTIPSSEGRRVGGREGDTKAQEGAREEVHAEGRRDGDMDSGDRWEIVYFLPPAGPMRN